MFARHGCQSESCLTSSLPARIFAGIASLFIQSAISLSMEHFEVSEIDLSAWSLSRSQEEKDKIAQVWHEAFKSHGLLYLSNHGLDSLYQEL